MNQKKAKALRKEAKLNCLPPALLPWQAYSGLNNKNGSQQIILVECGKAIYKELKKEYYKKLNQ